MIAETPAEITVPGVAALAASALCTSYTSYLAARNIATAYPQAKYLEYLPSTEHGSNPGYHGEFEHVEPGTRADPAMPNLKGLPGYTEEYTLLLVWRGVLAFHDQDLKDQGIEKFKEFGNHFGPLHRHPTQSCIKGHNDLTIIYEGPEPGADKLRKELGHGSKNTYVQWHTDQCHEPQPPAVSMLVALEVPAAGGGDTLFCSATRAYDTLSPAMQTFVCTLWSENSSKLISDSSAKIGGPVRRAPVPVAHPAVRVHPTTGQRSLFHNPHFSTDRIHGLKKQENIAVGSFLKNQENLLSAMIISALPHEK
ncbi:hypothetical protein H2204_015648 [Knufia peltigerae]|uniref:TauD/TfdA-like domain-containing protein n=1 Tax=Knufia peltigerae TaxID=1002370 RepID=A0AA38X828_9EURO|nr:hypothetical protein H2204_015648 [Knufia peltigerae]